MSIMVSPARFPGRLHPDFVVTAVDEPPPPPPPDPIAPPPTQSSGVIAYSLTNDWNYYEKNINSGVQTPASLVKLMTAYIVYSLKGPLGTDVLDSETAVITTADISAAGGSEAGFLNGDTATWHTWLQALLHTSDNAVGEMIARVIGGEYYTNRAGFIAQMNTLADDFEMTGTTFVSPSGFPADTDTSTPADLAKLAAVVFTTDGGAMRDYMNNSSLTYTVTAGPNAGSFGPFANPIPLLKAPIDAGVVAAKGGFHTGPAPDVYNALVLWEAPNGEEIIFVTLAATTNGNRYLDMRACMWEIADDFPELLDGWSAGTDADFASVKMLVGFDGEIVDESSVGRTLTARGNAAVNTDNPLVGEGDLVLDGTGDWVDTPDTDDVDVGAGDCTIECFIRGSGAEPSTLTAFVSKWNTTSNQRQWTLQYDPATDQVTFFASTNGSNFPLATFNLGSVGAMTPAVFFNGAKRHIMAVKNGSTIKCYVNGHVGGVTDTAATLFANTALMTIGARAAGSSAEFLFTGKMDEVRVTIGVDRTDGADKAGHITGRAWPRS